MKPFGRSHSAPPSQPTQLGAPRGHTPNGGVPRAPTPNGGVPYAQHPHAQHQRAHHAQAQHAQPQHPHAQQHHYANTQMPSVPPPPHRPSPMPMPYHHQPSVHPSPVQPQLSHYPQPLPPLPTSIAPHAPPVAHAPPPPPAPVPAAAPPSSRKAKTGKSKPVANVGEPQLGFRFKLTFPDGHVENMLVDAERALIGSAAHCEVRLPPETAATEHVEIFAHDGDVHFATKPLALANLPILDGNATNEGTWPKGSTLKIGDIAMTVELVSLGMAKAKPPIWALLVAIPAVALTAIGIALAQPVDRGWPPIPEAPVLIGPKDARCPDIASAEQRTVYANERLRIALAKRERSPFAPQEGFEAVQQFETAAACFRASNMANEAKDADESADALRAKLDEEYRLRRVRLEHAVRTHQIGPAKRELSVLIPMTSHRRGPYTEWLAVVDRAASFELDQQGRLQP